MTTTTTAPPTNARERAVVESQADVEATTAARELALARRAQAFRKALAGGTTRARMAELSGLSWRGVRKVIDR